MVLAGIIAPPVDDLINALATNVQIPCNRLGCFLLLISLNDKAIAGTVYGGEIELLYLNIEGRITQNPFEVQPEPHVGRRTRPLWPLVPITALCRIP